MPPTSPSPFGPASIKENRHVQPLSRAGVQAAHQHDILFTCIRLRSGVQQPSSMAIGAIAAATVPASAPLLPSPRTRGSDGRIGHVKGSLTDGDLVGARRRQEDQQGGDGGGHQRGSRRWPGDPRTSVVPRVPCKRDGHGTVKNRRATPPSRRGRPTRFMNNREHLPCSVVRHKLPYSTWRELDLA